MAASLVQVGTVGKPHGVRGEMKVIPETDDPTLFGSLQTVHLGESEDRSRPVEVESVRFQQTRKGATPLLKLGGYDSPEAIRQIRGSRLYVEQERIAVPEDEVFAFEVVDMTVVTDKGSVLGKVVDVLEAPAHDLYLVQKLDGSTSLVPAVPEFIKGIDVEAMRLTIAPIEGLLD